MPDDFGAFRDCFQVQLRILEPIWLIAHIDQSRLDVRIFEYLVDRLLAQYDRVVDLDFELPRAIAPKKFSAIVAPSLSCHRVTGLKPRMLSVVPWLPQNLSGSDSVLAISAGPG